MLRRGLGGFPVKDTCKYTLYFLTSNKHKVLEVREIAGKYGVCIEQEEGGKLEIQSNSLEEIAWYAAMNYYIRHRKPVLVEDAGLFIKSLNGFPGPYSSYVYGTIGYHGILKLMEGTGDREAYFESVAVIIHEPYIIVEKARVYGEIAYEPRGSRGFGFDPIFIPRGEKRTFAEMSIAEKNMYSHRARAVSRALEKFLAHVKV